MEAVDRPDPHSCTRRQAWTYIEHLERLLARQIDAVPVRARNTDPGTSHKAAFDAFPAAKTNRGRILRSLARAGERGMTQDEVTLETGISGAWKRLSELHQGGWVVTLETRAGKLSGSDQNVYTITDRGRTALGRESEGMPPVAPVKRDGTPASPPSELHVPATLFGLGDDEE
jgi:hypothetical protein